MSSNTNSFCNDPAFLNMLDQKRRNALINVPPIRYDNLATNPYVQINPATQMFFTKFDLDMRRKAEVLEYNANKTNRMTNNLTKKEKWAALVNGSYQQRTYSQAYIQENTLPNGYVQTCGNTIAKPTSASDVPGPPMMLYMDQNIPLYNYISDIGGKAYALMNETTTTTQPYFFTDISNVSIPKTVSISYGIQFTTFTTFYLSNPPTQNNMEFSIQTPIALQISNTMKTYPTSLYSQTGAFTIYVSNVYMRVMFSTSQALSAPPNITTQFQYSSTNPLSMDISMNTTNQFSYSASVYLGTVSIDGLVLRSIKGYIYDIQMGVEYTLIPNTTNNSNYLTFFGSNNESISTLVNVWRDEVSIFENCSCQNSVPTIFPALTVSSQ